MGTSVLVYDIKKENWALTAGWRRQFSHVVAVRADGDRFGCASTRCSRSARGLSEVKDTQNVADILVDPTGEKETRDHWQTTAHALLCGAILHVLYAETDKTLAGVAAFLSDPACTQQQTLERMLTTRTSRAGPHPVVAQAAREMLNKSDNELSGVFSTAMACLGLYRDPGRRPKHRRERLSHRGSDERRRALSACTWSCRRAISPAPGPSSV